MNDVYRQVTCLLAAIALTPDNTIGQEPLSEYAKLVSPDPAPDSLYGSGADVSPSYAIVGEVLDSAPHFLGGAAFAYDRVGADWILLDRIAPSDHGPDMRFGSAVVIHGGLAAIRADDRTQSNGGAVYLFERSGGHWSELQKLTSSVLQCDQFFGSSIAIDGDTMLIGSAGRDTSAGSSSGVVTWYERSGASWHEAGEIRPSVDPGHTRFGSSLALRDGRAVVGAPAYDPFGAIYVFDRTGSAWTESAVLQPPQPLGLAEGRFGQSVALHGDRVLVGHPPDNDGWRGSVHDFEEIAPGSWLHRERLFASDGDALDMFGASIALDGDTLVVGAPLKDGPAIDSGATYVFRDGPTGWTETAKLVPSDADSQPDRLGHVVGFGRGVVLSSAPLDGSGAGSAYLHLVSIGINSCVATVNSTGRAATIVALGSPDAAANDFTLVATQVPLNQFGYFLVSRFQDFIPLPPGSIGNLCLGVPVGRFVGQISSTGDSGTLAIDVDLTALPFSPPVAVNAGDTYHFQGWFRDSWIVGSTSNFSDRTTVRFE